MSTAKELIDRINNKNGKIWSEKEKLAICLDYITENCDLDSFEEFLVDAAANGLPVVDDDDEEDDEDDEEDIDDDEDEDDDGD
jgi:hypothetical protein